MKRTTIVTLVLGIAAVSGGSSSAGTRLSPLTPVIRSVTAPWGLQGVTGNGRNVAAGFVLSQSQRRPCEVEVQYGIDRNGDGMVSEDEYRTATEDRLDQRNTRMNKAPQLYRSGLDLGAANAFVWMSGQDLKSSVLPLVAYARTPQGRLIPDPDNPGSFLFATGAGGSPRSSGVTIRMRPILLRAHRRDLHGDWAYSEAFALDNDAHPSMTIDAAAQNPGRPTTIRVEWTAFDASSEDLNGNGVLDVGDSEDLDGDGTLYAAPVAVAFDYHRLAPGEDPATMTLGQLADLRWKPCTRDATDPAGQTDSLDITWDGLVTGGGVASAPPPFGRHWVFSWDAAADHAVTGDGYLLRGAPMDVRLQAGETVYSRVIVVPSN